MTDLKRTILVVDDDPLVRRIITKSLIAEGYEAMAASSGAEGLELARAHPPDLILLDLMMPGLDGYAVCDQLRQSYQTANVPVIMLTALDQTEAKVRGLKTGADDYITKPFDLEELQTRIGAHLRRSERDLGVNPLTLLPGNTQIEQHLQKRLVNNEPLAVLYIDLTNFKSYNDEYGWLKGDGVIKLLAQQIATAVHLAGGHDDFIGHVGGDDFIVISTPNKAELLAQQVITGFDAAIPQYYAEDARARGYIQVLDRRDKPFRAPLVCVAIAIVTNEQTQLEHSGQIAARAAELKQYVKSLAGSHYAFDRRRK